MEVNKKELKEQEIRTLFITPALQQKGWAVSVNMREEYYFTDGRVLVVGNQHSVAEGKKADYLLYHKGKPIAVVEAKDNKHAVGGGIQQAMEYAQILDLKFAYSCNGDAFLEHDFITGKETEIKLEDFPTEEEQFQAYKQAVQMMAGKKVIIRTLDIGADKQVDYFNLGNEDNPALGYRAIRICLTQPDIFKTQLRAILRASAYGNMSVMFPMITDVEEVKQAKLILEKIKNELKDEKIPFNEEIKIGVMIETPAAVMISGELAREADFFSIGTNDLTQLTLGMDRTNSRLERFYNTHHPALLKMIRIIANNIHLEGKKIALCGDLAADLSLTEKFIQMGIDELSVAPNQVLALRKKIREIQ